MSPFGTNKARALSRSLLAKRIGAIPSDFVERSQATIYANEVHGRLKDAGKGWWELVNSPKSVAVVGTRKPSPEGVARTRKMVTALLQDDFTNVSGLAAGVDTAAHVTAIAQGGRTIAVLGTPLSKAYPVSNAKLQKEIAKNHLLISQVPVKRYGNQANPTANNFFFPERNVTMSALTDATIMIEAGETSGTLVQARHALKQGRSSLFWRAIFGMLS